MVKYLDICYASGKGLISRIQKEHLHISNKRHTTYKKLGKTHEYSTKGDNPNSQYKFEMGFIRTNQIKITMIPK